MKTRTFGRSPWRAISLVRIALAALVAGHAVDALAVPTCTVASGATLSFGAVVALASTGNVTASTNSTFWVNCTADVTAVPGLYSGSPRAMTSGAHSLPFSLSAASAGGAELPSASPGTGLGIPRNGTNQTVTLYGRIQAGNFKSLPSGAYATSITLTVEY